MDAICSTFDWKMRSVASPATLEPRNLGFVMTQLTLEAFVVSVLLFENFYHGLEVADVYRLAEDAFRVVVLDNGKNARHEGLMHWAVGVVLRFACRKRTVKRFTHDGSPAIYRDTA